MPVCYNGLLCKIIKRVKEKVIEMNGIENKKTWFDMV